MENPKMDCHKGIELYERAKRIIPGGTQLLSKRPEMFLPGQWPAYYRKCKGVEVWDLDGNKFIDMSISGVGACVLGYADPDVDAAVREAIASGTMCTLNCPEEIELAELLCAIHPWAEMARFGRCGGEAMAVAARIARAATGRDKIAFCGYHGWHDWYLAANLADDRNLDGQLLPGLEPAGVPRALTGTVIPFNYNQPDDLDRVVESYGGSLAAIIMEPVRHSEPACGFLEHVRKAADKAGAVLVFDEVTSGWRMNVGGIHLLYKAHPDMAVFAKGMSNGYPMAAIIGRREVMEAAQRTFISSTYWTERIGPVAALSTIKKMQRLNVPEHLCSIGSRVRDIWCSAAARHGLAVKIHGILPLSIFGFDYGETAPLLHTLFTQEMLKRGFLASKAFYAAYAHQNEHLDHYSTCVDEVFSLISAAIKTGDVGKYLTTPVAHTGFKRLA